MQRRLSHLRRRYPTLGDLEAPAGRRLPYFAFDYLQGGTVSEQSRARNLRAFAEIEIVPRYGGPASPVDLSTTLFGVQAAAPIGMAPVGSDGAFWPDATRLTAAAAQELRVPHTLSTMAGASIETIAPIAGDMGWFQLYSFPEDDHATSFDLIRRAQTAGMRALVVTMDVPAPSRKVRDIRNGLGVPLRIGPKMLAGVLARPSWLLATMRMGLPRHANLEAYCPPGSAKHVVDTFVARGRAGADTTWATLSRFRERWKGPMLVKGILHPLDAEHAASIGMDGIVVSNHGGRQFDAAPATIDVLPAIKAAVGDRLTVALDSGVMSGNDVLKAVALGADFVMVGRALMLGLAAIGPFGPRHVIDTLIDELRAAMIQTGISSVAQARTLTIRHPAQWTLADFAAPCSQTR